MSDLPPGFVLEPPHDDLPPGFVLEPPAPKPAAAPGALESFARGIGNQVSFGAGPALEAGFNTLVHGGSYDENRKAVLARTQAGEEAHPIASTAGNVAGLGATMAVPVGAAAEGAGAAAHALQGAKVGGIFSAASGAGNALSQGGSAGDVANAAISSGAIGAATGGALGAGVGSLVRGAPERVDDRIIANIARGEAGGAAKPSLAMKMAAKDDVIPQLEASGLKGDVAKSAASKPGKVADLAAKAINEYTTKKLDPIYAAIDAGPAVPKAFELKYQLLQMQDRLKSSGELQQAASVGKYLKFIDDSVEDTQPLTASFMRKARNEVGLGNTFASREESETPAGIRAKQAIYGAFNQAIESAAAKTPGVDVQALKDANKTVSTLLTVKDALANRATKAKTGASNLSSAIMLGGVRMTEAAAVGHALVTGNYGELANIAGVLLGHEGIKVAPQIARRADYGLSRLELAARNGSTAAKVGRGAVEYGAARAAAPYVANTASKFLFPPPTQDGPQ